MGEGRGGEGRGGEGRGGEGEGGRGGEGREKRLMTSFYDQTTKTVVRKGCVRELQATFLFLHLAARNLLSTALLQHVEVQGGA